MPRIFGSADQDEVFRALADPARRELLDLLRADPGANVAELTSGSGKSRYSVMRHLRILEAANLVTSRRLGRERQLYVNAAPLQVLYDRWISRHAGVLAGFVGSLQRSLEVGPDGGAESGISRAREQPRHHLEQYVRTTPQRLWQALTDPSETRLYYHGLEVESVFEVGAQIRYLRKREGHEPRVEVDGVVFDVEPGLRLGHTFRFPDRGEAPSRAIYRIDALGATLRLTLDHEGFEGETETYRITRDGWPPILSALKTLLETGTALEIPSGA